MEDGIMTVSDSVKIGDSIRRKAGRILDDLKDGKIPKKLRWYVVTTSASDDGLAYILSSLEFRHDYYRTRPLRILGLAGSRQEACEIVKDLFQEGYDQGKIDCMKGFLEDY